MVFARGARGNNPANSTVDRSGCALQRVVRMDAEGFQRSLVYHISNNKQGAIDEGRIWSAEGLRGEVVRRWENGVLE